MIDVRSISVPLDHLDTPEFTELFAYWNDLTGRRFAPSWEEVELIELSAKVLPYLTVVEVQPAPLDFVYKFWGTGHLAIKNRDCTGRSVRLNKPGEMAEVAFDQYRRTLEARKPLAFRRTVQGSGADEPPTQVTLRLPLSADGEGVHWIMALSDFSASPEMRDFYLSHRRGGAPLPSPRKMAGV